MTIITKEIAAKVLECVDAGLVKGVGKPIPGQMCVEAAVCYALGLPHGDDPKCVSPGLRHLKIRLNDSRWSSNEARAKGLRRLSVIQLGSINELDEIKFGKLLSGMTIKTILPPLLIKLAKKTFSRTEKEEFITIAKECEETGSRGSALKAKKAADAADAADAYATAYAVYAAADAAAYAYTTYAAAADAAAAAADAAYAAYAYAAAADAAAADAAYAADAAADKILSEFAENVVQILVKLDAPGSQWLYLTE